MVAHHVVSQLVLCALLAQFLAFCRRVKLGAMGTRRYPRCSPLDTRWTLKWRGDDQRLSQCLRATKCDKLSERDSGGGGLHMGRLAPRTSSAAPPVRRSPA